MALSRIAKLYLSTAVANPEAANELIALIEELETQVADLEARVTDLENP